MVFQAFLDESYDRDGWFVLAGFVASAEKWALFTDDWNEILPQYGLLDLKRDEYYFHMVEMNESKERRSRIPVFARVIERHVELMMSLRIYIPDLMKAHDRLAVPHRQMAQFQPMKELFKLGWTQMLANFANARHGFFDVIPKERDVSFIFDQHSAAKKFLNAWGEKERDYPQLSSMYDKKPSFENDRVFLPLQAADMLAWMIRDICSQNSATIKPLPSLQKFWDNPKPIGFLDAIISEDNIADLLLEGIADDLPRDLEVIDTKTGNKLQGRL